MENKNVPFPLATISQSAKKPCFLYNDIKYTKAMEQA